MNSKVIADLWSRGLVKLVGYRLDKPSEVVFLFEYVEQVKQ